MDEKFQALLKRLETVTTKLESMELHGAGAAAPLVAAAAVEDERPSPMVDAFNAFLSGPVAAYVNAASAINMPETLNQAKLVQACFEAQRDMLVLVAKCKKPDAATFQNNVLKATSDLLGQVQSAATSDRRAEDYNHRQAVAEAIPALGWVMVEKTPVPHINDMWEAGAFCQTKILTTYKGKDENHITYAKAVKTIFTDLAAFVKEFHKTGLEWNPKGIDINQGGSVTSGLKKVTKGEDWDPSKYGKAKPAPVPSVSTPKAATAAATKPPKCECVGGKKWEIENQVKNSSISIDAEVKQVVYIYKCLDSTITVKGKCNAITLDGCNKVSIVFDTVVAGIELVNCNSCKVMVLGLVQTVTIDKCSGTQVILNKESLGADVVTAKCSETNVVVPGENEGDEYKEFAIAEQFVSKWTGTTWDTNCMAHTG